MYYPKGAGVHLDSVAVVGRRVADALARALENKVYDCSYLIFRS